MIHGWSCEGRYWDEFGYVEELSNDFQVVVPDLRGHGESDIPANRDFSDAAFASDIIAVLDHLAIESAHVFGYSLGGWVVFELAAVFSSRVRTAIVGGAHPYDEDLSDLRAFAPAEILKAWEAVDAPLSPASRKRITLLEPQVLISIAIDRVDQTERLVTSDLPCLMICGTEDWRFEDMQRFSEERAHCEFVSLEGADHLQTWLQSDRVLPPVRSFLSSRRE